MEFVRNIGFNDLLLLPGQKFLELRIKQRDLLHAFSDAIFYQSGVTLGEESDCERNFCETFFAIKRPQNVSFEE